MNQILGVTLKILRTRGFAALVLAAFLVILLSASSANAGCAVPYKPATAPPIPFLYPPANQPSSHHDGDEFDKPASIVGLWHLIYTATSSTAGPLPVPVIPPGPPTSFQFLESFKIWHADGTEFENAFMLPEGGNICFGVWKDLGFGHVKLHHIGLMFAPTAAPPEFVTNIFTVDETDEVAPDGKTYKGTFTFELWPPFFDEVGIGKPLQKITGTTAGTRITVD